LQRAVEQIAQNSGFQAEDKAFSPHITLARVERNAPGAALQQLGQSLSTWAAEEVKRPLGNWTVHEVVHMRSQLRPEGPIYTPLAHFPFQA
jgi:RNA 2',3'-cyclic 3'-phosphodiesterase